MTHFRVRLFIEIYENFHHTKLPAIYTVLSELLMRLFEMKLSTSSVYCIVVCSGHSGKDYHCMYGRNFHKLLTLYLPLTPYPRSLLEFEYPPRRYLAGIVKGVRYSLIPTSGA